MKIVKTIRLVYLLISVYCLFLILETNLQLINYIMPFLYLWGIYFCFLLGNNSLTKSNKLPIIISNSNRQVSFLVFSCWIFLLLFAIIQVVKFYTGMSFTQVFLNIKNTVSNYYIYQNNMSSNDIGNSFKRIPYSLMLSFIYMSLLYSCITVICLGNKSKKYLLIFIVSLFCQLLFGLARGTTFELLHCALLIVFAFSMKRKMNQNYLLLLYISAFAILLTVFITNSFSRGFHQSDFESFSKSVSSIKILDNVLILNVPILRSIIIPLFSYLGYGMYYASIFFSQFFVNSLCFLFPFGYTIQHNHSFILDVNKIAEIGVKWSPDFIRFIDTFGIIGVLFLSYLLGKLLQSIKIKQPNSITGLILSFLIFFEMISLPIGKFIANSSSDKIAIILCLGFYLAPTNMIKGVFRR